MPLIPVFPAAIWLGVLEYDGGTSRAGFCVKKLRGRKRTVMGSAGIYTQLHQRVSLDMRL